MGIPPNLPKLDHFSIETLGDLGMLDFKNKQPLPSRQSDGLPCFPTMALATSSDTFIGPDVDSQTAKNREWAVRSGESTSTNMDFIIRNSDSNGFSASKVWNLLKKQANVEIQPSTPRHATYPHYASLYCPCS